VSLGIGINLSWLVRLRRRPMQRCSEIAVQQPNIAIRPIKQKAGGRYRKVQRRKATDGHATDRRLPHLAEPSAIDDHRR
jgi:hypothetical protein